MEASHRAQWVPIASIAILVLFFAPLPVFTPAEPERYVLAEIGTTGIGPVQIVRAPVIEQYGGSYALLRVTNTMAAQLHRLGVPLTELRDRTVIDFSEAGYRFDTTAGEPAIPPEMRTSQPSTYIVQFVGPIKSEWTDTIVNLGGTLSLYTPNNAYIVRMSASTAQAVGGLPFVGWVGAYHPAYKVSMSLRAATGPTSIMAFAYNDVPEDRLSQDVENLGGSILAVTSTPRLVQATIDGSRVPDVARLEDIEFVLPDEVKEPMDSRAGIVHGFHKAWYKETSGLPYTLTGVSNGPDGIRGTADDIYEIAGISDTGLDEGSASAGPNDFFQGPFTNPSFNDRVIRFTDRYGCGVPDGSRGGRVAHGTHVAGEIASNGYSWEKYLIEDKGRTDVSLTDFRWDQSEAGVAPEAKITFDGVALCSGGLSPSPSYWLEQYADGARIMVNSWGGAIGNYSGSAFSVDSQMDDISGSGTNDRMIEFSAANEGPDYNSLSGDAQGKNGLSIGASQNFRPDQFDADNPDLVASFSSKGGPRQSWGRIKPDLVAIGTAVVSLFARGEWEAGGQQIQPDYIMEVDKYDTATMSPGSDGIPDYRYMQGTSMSGPMASGLYLLAREYLREVYGIANPNSQLVKALLINGAVRMNTALYSYPGWDQGWGRIDLPNSLFPNPPKTVQFQEGSITTTGNTWSPTTINLTVASNTVPFKITLVWIDAPAPALSGGALVRDLNLRVTSPSGQLYCGNNYDSAGWTIAYPGPNCGAGNRSWDFNQNGWDDVNNVEQVEVKTPETGLWSVQVDGFNVPSTAKLALVVSADVGPRSEYRVDLSTTASTTVSVAPSGSVNLPFVVSNFGSVADHIALSVSNAPPFVTVRFAPAGPIGLFAGKSADDLATIEVAAGSPPSTYPLCLVGTSQDDPNPAGPSSDSICLSLEVTTTDIPPHVIVANGTTDELDPSIVVFNTTAGVRHIFIAYRKTLPTALGGKLGGVNVWVAHTTLDNNGYPILPFQHAAVSDANDLPNDLRLLRIPSGTYEDRVVISWTGTDPNVTNSDLASYGMMAWSDPPYTSWNLVKIETNEGSSTYNVARVSFPLFRKAGGGPGQLMWVWEHLDYVVLTGNPTKVQSHVKISTDGGVTWSTRVRIFPLSDSDMNFYFFPHGTVDQNDVAWFFCYFRTSSGNDRDLALRLYDGAWSATAPVVWNTVDNVQFPYVISTAEGPYGNRVYAAVTRDNLATDFKLWMVYINGTATPWSSTNMPRPAPAFTENCGVGCSISLDFAYPLGPFGYSASDANYNRRPVLNLVATNEGGTYYVWLPYMENSNPYDTPNLWTYYGRISEWQAKSPLLTMVTADGYAKGHQMTETLTTGGVARLYETYHASRHPMTSVNYDVYLAIYNRDWEAAADTEGPITSGSASVPSLVDLSQTTSIRIAANVNDMATGNSTIAAAEFFFDSLGAPGTGRALQPSDTAFDSPAEGVQILAGVPVAWPSPSCHTIYIRGQDAPGNWGPADQTQVCVEGFSGPDTKPPVPPKLTYARLLAPSFGDVDVGWQASTDEGSSGGTLFYRVFRSGSLAGPWSQIGSDVPGGRSQYNFTDFGVGSNTYYYYVQSVDGANLTNISVERAGRTEFAVNAGLNFLSAPFIQYDSKLTTIFQTVSMRGAWTYEASTKAWKTYSSSRPAGQNNLRNVPIGMGVYVDAASAGTFAVAGLVPTSTSIQLYSGWNFVGNPTMRAGYTVANLKAEVGAVSVLGFATTAPGYTVVLPDSAVLGPGIAFWVKVTANPVWSVPGA